MDPDIASRDAIDHPAQTFRIYRDFGGDVQWSVAQRAWVLLGHEAVEAAFRDVENLSADRVAPLQRVAAGRSAAFGQVVELLSGWMNFRDPPAHTHLREPVRAAFTPRAIERLDRELREITTATLDAITGDEADLAHDFARPIPALVIAALLGVEAAERDRFTQWSDDLADIVFSMTPGTTDEGAIVRATEEFRDFFSARIERERVSPTGSLLTAMVGHDGGLSPMELVGACTLLLFGGHETTTTLLTNSIALLLERPDLQAWLRQHPEADETAIDEFVRVGGPARSMVRKVRIDHERGGQALKAGQNVYLSIAAANHDDRVFADPGRIDLTRTPNPHLGFGWGLHYCLGATLARLEARIALRALLDRFTDLQPSQPVPAVRASALGFGRRPLLTRIIR